VRNLKAAHFDPGSSADQLFWRGRDDTTFRPFRASDYADLRASFAVSERLDLLDR
jgi:hypothetical protein